jgi:hypothetical protein
VVFHAFGRGKIRTTKPPGGRKVQPKPSASATERKEGIDGQRHQTRPKVKVVDQKQKYDLLHARTPQLRHHSIARANSPSLCELPRFRPRSRPGLHLILKQARMMESLHRRARTRKSSHEQRRGATGVFEREASYAFDFRSSTTRMLEIFHLKHARDCILFTPTPASFVGGFQHGVRPQHLPRLFSRFRLHCANLSHGRESLRQPGMCRGGGGMKHRHKPKQSPTAS